MDQGAREADFVVSLVAMVKVSYSVKEKLSRLCPEAELVDTVFRELMCI